MMDDYEFYYGDETTQHNSKWDKTRDSEENRKKRHILDEVVTVLRALVNIFDIIESKIRFL